MTQPAPLEKWKRAQNLSCQKCGIGNDMGSNRSVRFIDAVRSEPTAEFPQGQIQVPEHLLVSCWQCGFGIGKFAPIDAA